jgi:hypothetical protein
MKDKLTPEQSHRLIELGVDASNASMCMLYFPESDSSEPLEAWQMWEENGKLLCNPDESQVQDVECIIVPKDADYDQSAKEEHPIFNLSDILSLLPKEIIADTIMGKDWPCAFTMRWDGNRHLWVAAYETLPRPLDVGDAPELIDALFELLVWCITNKHLKV